MENVMMLWIILTILTSVATVLVTAPLLRRLGAPGSAAPAGDIAGDLDQLSGIEQRAAAGALGADEAEAARADIKRRILAASRAERAAAEGLSSGERKLVLVAVAGLMILGSVGLYIMYGTPTLPGASAEAERLQGAAAVEALAAATSQVAAQPLAVQRQGPPQGQAPGQLPRQLGSVDEMVERLVEKLKRNPNDADGWRMLGWSYFNTERFADSAAAYAKAVALSPGAADLASAYGEALVRAGDGRVGEEAKTIFAKALQLDAKEPRARFFMGVVKEQGGDKLAALDDWIAILNEADSKAPWFADLTRRVTELAQETGTDLGSRLRRADVAPTGGVLAALERPQQPVAAESRMKDGPTDADVRGAEAMLPADRATMIRGMVDGLAARLEQSPGDVEGWLKLIRSRKVLGETQEAEQALHRAMDIFKSAPQEQARIVAIGQEMGLAQ
jgi:cytochrome c-type biogenesis protein CcmH